MFLVVFEGFTEQEAIMKCIPVQGIDRINAIGRIAWNQTTQQAWASFF
mgnify:CR=1 FL=1